MNTNKNIVTPENVGNWRLLSLVVEFQDTGEKISEPWHGRQIIQADGTYMQVFTKAGRGVPNTQADQAAALAGTIAISGSVRSEGNVSVIKTELAANPQAIGTESRSTVEISGNRKSAESQWGPNPRYGNRVTRTHFAFERE